MCQSEEPQISHPLGLSLQQAAAYSITYSISTRPFQIQGRAETFGGAGAQNIKGAHETRL